MSSNNSIYIRVDPTGQTKLYQSETKSTSSGSDEELTQSNKRTPFNHSRAEQAKHLVSKPQASQFLKKIAGLESKGRTYQKKY